MDPVLEGAALLLHLRGGSGDEPALGIHRAVLEEDPRQVGLHRGVGHRVSRAVHQVLRNGSKEEVMHMSSCHISFPHLFRIHKYIITTLFLGLRYLL